MPGRTTKQSTKSKNTKSSSKPVVRTGGSSRKSASINKQLTLVAALFILFFGAIGILRLTGSHADTTKIAADKCYLLGRVYSTSTSSCKTTCLQGAGVYTTTNVSYGYCSYALSASVTKLRCETLNRVFVLGQGCARNWLRPVVANAKQCAVLTDAYTLSTPYDYCVPPVSSANPAGWSWPVPSTTSVISFWGAPTAKGSHKGIDIGNTDGTTLNKNVVAAHAGTVTKSWTDANCGQMLVISAANTTLYHAYQHVIPGSTVVKVGTVVKAGQPIGKVGNYGATTCGDNDGQFHLHISIEKGNWMTYYAGKLDNTVDPCTILTGCPPAPATPVAKTTRQ